MVNRINYGMVKIKHIFSKTLDELCKKMIIMYARIDNKKIRGYITLFETAVVDKETQEIVVTYDKRCRIIY